MNRQGSELLRITVKPTYSVGLDRDVFFSTNGLRLLNPSRRILTYHHSGGIASSQMRSSAACDCVVAIVMQSWNFIIVLV
jgi:hypothetical protein